MAMGSVKGKERREIIATFNLDFLHTARTQPNSPSVEKTAFLDADRPPLPTQSASRPTSGGKAAAGTGAVDQSLTTKGSVGSDKGPAAAAPADMDPRIDINGSGIPPTNPPVAAVPDTNTAPEPVQSDAGTVPPVHAPSPGSHKIPTSAASEAVQNSAPTQTKPAFTTAEDNHIEAHSAAVAAAENPSVAVDNGTPLPLRPAEDASKETTAAANGSAIAGTTEPAANGHSSNGAAASDIEKAPLPPFPIVAPDVPLSAVATHLPPTPAAT